MTTPSLTRLLAAVVVAATLLAACSTDPAPISAPSSTQTNDGDAAAAPAAPGSNVAVTSGQTPLGDVLVGPDGRTLYGFTNDTQAASTCTGTCADAWPPLIVSEDWDVAPGLDSGIFATTVRDDGQLQLVAGKWPLYYFAGDAVPGDVGGQGSGDVWFVVDLQGILVTDAAPAGGASGAPAGTEVAVSTGSTSLGDALVDGDGLSLYGFTQDTDGVPSCVDACADAWPPVLVPSTELPAGLDPAVFSVVERPDGTFQLSAGVWPLYRFAGDAAPGDVNGQGSGDAWFLAAPDGSLLRGAGAADDSSSSTDDDQGGEGGSYGSPNGY